MCGFKKTPFSILQAKPEENNTVHRITLRINYGCVAVEMRLCIDWFVSEKEKHGISS